MRELTEMEVAQMRSVFRNYSGPTGHTEERDGVVYIEIGKTPWEPLLACLPDTMTIYEKKDTIRHHFFVKPWAEEIQRLASEMCSSLAGMLKP